jgi:hypothetical protein
VGGAAMTDFFNMSDKITESFEGGAKKIQDIMGEIEKKIEHKPANPAPHDGPID